MPNQIIPRLARLADHLVELRLRLKEAARFEVAQAIADALAEAARTWIAGRPLPPPARREAGWDDPWNDPRNPDDWDDAEFVPRKSLDDRPAAPNFETAIAAGLVVARWTLGRTGHPVASVAAAIAVALTVLCAGDRVKPIFDVLTTAQELLTFPRSRM